MGRVLWYCKLYSLLDDEDKKFYYFDPVSQRTSWNHPRAKKVTITVEPELPPIPNFPHENQDVNQPDSPRNDENSGEDKVETNYGYNETQNDEQRSEEIYSRPQSDKISLPPPPIIHGQENQTPEEPGRSSTLRVISEVPYVPDEIPDELPSLWKHWFRIPRDKVEYSQIIYMCAQGYHIVHHILAYFSFF